MIELKNILVARDFSASSDRALMRAKALAERTGAHLHLAFVEVLFEDVYAPIAQRGHAKKLEEELVEGVGAVPYTPVILRDVAAAPALVAYADAHAIDLIVMGTHGRRGLRRVLLGSTAEEVVRTAPCPVLTMRADAPTGFDVLLVPVDFSEHARTALAMARQLAATFDARIELLHVIEDHLHPAFYGYSLESIYDLDPDIDRKALEELRTFFEETDGPDVAARFHVRGGTAVHEIVGYAEETGSALIVMGTHGLRGMEHFLLGSVAEKVVRRAPCPVLTVKPYTQAAAHMAEASAALHDLPS